VTYPKTSEPIEMLFAMWTRVGPRNHVLGDGLDSAGEGAIWGHLAADGEVYEISGMSYSYSVGGSSSDAIFRC